MIISVPQFNGSKFPMPVSDPRRLVGPTILVFLIFFLVLRSYRPVHFDVESEKLSIAQNAAFVTYLRGNGEGSDSIVDDNDDVYYLGTRVLNYQFVHKPSTRSPLKYPFVVLVQETVSERKRQKLRQEGAVVIPVEAIGDETASKGVERWRDNYTKLRVLQLVQYDKICFIDADGLIIRHLDDIFNDPATQLQQTKEIDDALLSDEGPLPETYMFAGKPERRGYDVLYPNVGDYMNGGFFVARPSIELFDYYRTILGIKDRFSHVMVDQDLFNYAHRWGGNMPWTELDPQWNMNFATADGLDYGELGVASYHEKFWDHAGSIDAKLQKMWWQNRWEMEGYYMAMWETKMEEDFNKVES